MQNKNDYITMLGTGNAHATRCYNTCFTLHGENGVLLVDAGGGNGSSSIIRKTERSTLVSRGTRPRQRLHLVATSLYQTIWRR